MATLGVALGGVAVPDAAAVGAEADGVVVAAEADVTAIGAEADVAAAGAEADAAAVGAEADAVFFFFRSVEFSRRVAGATPCGPEDHKRGSSLLRQQMCV